MFGIGGIIASIGFRALAGKAVSNAAADVKAAGKWIGGLDLVHILLLVACIALVVDHVALVMAHRHSAKVEKQLSAAIGQLATSQANEAVLTITVGHQNAAIADLGSKSQAQQAIAAKASHVAAQRADEAQATSERLKQSSRLAPLKSATVSPCEPSSTLKDQWK